jgi:hypothetical protein
MDVFPTGWQTGVARTVSETMIAVAMPLLDA